MTRTSSHRPVQVVPGERGEATSAEAECGVPAWVTEPRDAVERFMADHLGGLGLPENLRIAMEDALLGGGKRLRPLLVVHSCAAVGGTLADCLPAAAAVEMIHAFSLVHDDLPALDDDDLRRGRPTVHVAHGEAMAVLAGDGLMSVAFGLLGEIDDRPGLGERLVGELATGTTKMIAGQVLDTVGGFSDGVDDLGRVQQIHEQKTGALILASCRMGAICGVKQQGDGLAAIERVSRYGAAIGLMFQIVDDILDVEQTVEHTGKRTSKDTAAGKLTYPAAMGVEASRREVARLESEATEAIAPLGDKAMGLRELCRYLAVRTR